MTPCQGPSFSDPDLEMHAHKVKKRFKLLEASLVAHEEPHVEPEERLMPEEGLWGCLPELILWNILMRLPLSTQYRFQCVCSGWKVMLSALLSSGLQHSPPTCTIMGNGEFSEDWFFSHEENRWFRFPMQPRWCMELNWRLVASERGLLCYKNADDDCASLLLCNPITRSYCILTPTCDYAVLLTLTNFIVDLEAKAFKLVLMGPESFVIYDSVTLEWKVFEFPEPHHADYEFVWKKKVICNKSELSCYFIYDLESERWSAMEDVGLPCDTTMYYHIGSWKDQVVLVQLHAMTEDPVRIWMLKDHGMDTLDLSLSNWEKIPVEIPDSMKTMVHELHDCMSHGREYVCFTTGWTHHWVMYTFETRMWRVMPCRGRSNPRFDEEYDWFNFEPQTLMDLEPSVEGNDFVDPCHPEESDSEEGDSEESDSGESGSEESDSEESDRELVD